MNQRTILIASIAIGLAAAIVYGVIQFQNNPSEQAPAQNEVGQPATEQTANTPPAQATPEAPEVPVATLKEPHITLLNALPFPFTLETVHVNNKEFATPNIRLLKDKTFSKVYDSALKEGVEVKVRMNINGWPEPMNITCPLMPRKDDGVKRAVIRITRTGETFTCTSIK